MTKARKRWLYIGLTILFSFLMSTNVFATEVPAPEAVEPAVEETAVPGEETETHTTDISDLVLLEYEVIDGELVSEQQVTLRFKLQNTSTTQSITNVRLTYGSSQDGLYPVFSESNTSFVSHVAPGETIYVDKIFNIASNTAQVFELPIYLHYYEESGNAYYEDSLLYLPVFGSSSFQVQVDVPTTVYTGSSVAIGGFCRNSGLIDIGELVMELQVEQDGAMVTLQEFALGSLPAGDQLTFSESVDGEVLFANGVTSQDISFLFTFSDTEGNQFSLPSEEYSLSLLDVPEAVANTIAESENTQNSTLSMVFSLVSIVMIVLLAGCIIYIYKKRRNK